MNVVSGLLLATMAVLLSTAPPAARFYDWGKPLPYLCVLAAFPPALGGIIVGAVMGLGVTAIQPRYFEKICKTRLRIICLLVLIAYPFLIMGAATLTFAIGLVSAGWVTDYKLVMAGSTCAFVLPISLVPVFFWVVSG